MSTYNIPGINFFGDWRKPTLDKEYKKHLFKEGQETFSSGRDIELRINQEIKSFNQYQSYLSTKNELTKTTLESKISTNKTAINEDMEKKTSAMENKHHEDFSQKEGRLLSEKEEALTEKKRAISVLNDKENELKYLRKTRKSTPETKGFFDTIFGHLILGIGLGFVEYALNVNGFTRMSMPDYSIIYLSSGLSAIIVLSSSMAGLYLAQKKWLLSVLLLGICYGIVTVLWFYTRNDKMTSDLDKFLTATNIIVVTLAIFMGWYREDRRPFLQLKKQISKLYKAKHQAVGRHIVANKNIEKMEIDKEKKIENLIALADADLKLAIATLNDKLTTVKMQLNKMSSQFNVLKSEAEQTLRDGYAHGANH